MGGGNACGCWGSGSDRRQCGSVAAGSWIRLQPVRPAQCGALFPAACPAHISSRGPSCLLDHNHDKNNTGSHGQRHASAEEGSFFPRPLSHRNCSQMPAALSCKSETIRAMPLRQETGSRPGRAAATAVGPETGHRGLTAPVFMTRLNLLIV